MLIINTKLVIHIRLMDLSMGRENRSKDIQSREPLKINISTPCYGSTYSAAYLMSIIALLTTWKESQTGFTFTQADTADIELSRNILISNFYFNEKDCTHILFIDSDMGFDSSLVHRMIQQNKDVVGVISPKRQLDLRRLHAESSVPFETALAKSADFIGDILPQHANTGFVEVSTCGGGILLVSRQCIEKMIKGCPDIVETKRHRNNPITREFKEFLTPFNKISTETHRLSEDISFCYRWTEKCQGKIFANIDSYIRHVGTQTVNSRFLDLYLHEALANSSSEPQQS